eukprot:m.87252 g.87252  ORF g.87252 m.87252 type:complete len:136 (-) comp8308_c0_seq2:41-448(-)
MSDALCTELTRVLLLSGSPQDDIIVPALASVLPRCVPRQMLRLINQCICPLTASPTIAPSGPSGPSSWPAERFLRVVLRAALALVTHDRALAPIASAALSPVLIDVAAAAHEVRPPRHRRSQSIPSSHLFPRLRP